MNCQVNDPEDYNDASALRPEPTVIPLPAGDAPLPAAWIPDTSTTVALATTIAHEFQAGSAPLPPADYGPELDACRIHLKPVPSRPPAILKLADQTICTPGNISVVSAQAKAGKTAAIGGIVASTLSQYCGDALGFSSIPHGGKAVICFDTEQSDYDSWRLFDRACTRAGVADMPDNLRAYRLMSKPTQKRRAFVEFELERASENCEGVHLVIIDGVADLCIDPNDTAEAFALVEWLQHLAVQYDCPILMVIHENPAGPSGAGKTRGHLGSHLERKAESNLRIQKDSADVSVIYSEKSRSANIPKDKGPRFRWCDEAGMHMTYVGTEADERRTRRSGEQSIDVEEVFAGVTGWLTHTQLKQRVAECLGLKLSSTSRKIKDWLNLDLIQRSPTGAGYAMMGADVTDEAEPPIAEGSTGLQLVEIFPKNASSSKG